MIGSLAQRSNSGQVPMAGRCPSGESSVIINVSETRTPNVGMSSFAAARLRNRLGIASSGVVGQEEDRSWGQPFKVR